MNIRKLPHLSHFQRSNQTASNCKRSPLDAKAYSRSEPRKPRRQKTFHIDSQPRRLLSRPICAHNLAPAFVMEPQIGSGVPVFSANFSGILSPRREIKSSSGAVGSVAGRANRRGGLASIRGPNGPPSRRARGYSAPGRRSRTGGGTQTLFVLSGLGRRRYFRLRAEISLGGLEADAFAGKPEK